MNSFRSLVLSLRLRDRYGLWPAAIAALCKWRYRRMTPPGSPVRANRCQLSTKCTIFRHLGRGPTVKGYFPITPFCCRHRKDVLFPLVI